MIGQALSGAFETKVGGMVLVRMDFEESRPRIMPKSRFVRIRKYMKNCKKMTTRFDVRPPVFIEDFIVSRLLSHSVASASGIVASRNFASRRR